MKKCLLCSQPAFITGIFVPDEPAAWGISSVAYALCLACIQRPNLWQACEDAIEARLCPEVRHD